MPETARRGRRELLYGALVLAYVLSLFHRTALSAAEPELEAAFRLSAVEYANLGSAFFYAYALVQIPTGLLVDAWGPRRTAALGMALMGVSSMTFALADSYGALFLIRFVMGIGGGMIFPAVLKTQLCCFDESRFGLATGITTFFGNLGGSLSQLPMVCLTEWLGWEAGFLLAGGGTLLLGVGIWLLRGGDAPPDPAAPAGRSISGEVLRLLRNPSLYPPVAANFLAQGIFYCVFQWGIPFLRDTYALSGQRAGTITAFLPAAAAVSTLLAGQLSDRLRSRRRVGIAGAALVLGVMAALAAADTLACSAAAVIFSGAAAYYSIYYGTAKDVCPPGSAGLASSLANMGTFAGASLVPLAFGWMVDRGGAGAAGYHRGFLLLTVLAGINLLVSFLVRETHCKNCWEEPRPAIRR